MLTKIIACAAIVALPATAAHAYSTSSPYMTGTFSVTAEEAATNGWGVYAIPGQFPGAPANATFTYTGALNFSDKGPSDINSSFFGSSSITNYSGSGTVSVNGAQVANFNTLNTFLDSIGSAGGYPYASAYQFDLGTLAAGTILDVTHDDGISIYQSGAAVGTTVSGPTVAVTDQVELTHTADTTLYYTRQNGTPSILQVNVPEPMSIALFSAGLIGLGVVRRCRRNG